MKLFDLVVVDVGNSACKIGEVQAEQIQRVHRQNLEETACQPWRHPEVIALLAQRPKWVVSGSNPPIIKSFADWLSLQDQSLRVIDAHTPLPLVVDVQLPERVGRDRLLNALAAETKPAIIISAGTAVTVDAVDASGRFLGGAIFPGLRLMAKALHDHTAKLPLIEVQPPKPTLPAKNTDEAIHAGIVYAVVGGIAGCVNEMIPVIARPTNHSPSQNVTIYVTGGDGPQLLPHFSWQTVSMPHMALQGMIVASRTLWS